MTLTGNRRRRAYAKGGFPPPVGDYQAAGLDLDGFLMYARPVVRAQDDAARTNESQALCPGPHHRSHRPIHRHLHQNVTPFGDHGVIDFGGNRSVPVMKGVRITRIAFPDLANTFCHTGPPA